MPRLPRCPACDADCCHTRTTVRGLYPIARCGACGHSFVCTEALPAGHLDGLYAEHYEGFREDPVFEVFSREFVSRELRPRLAPHGSRPARVLDVGCGNGAFLGALRDTGGFEGVGFDVSVAAVEACRARGLTAYAGDFTAPHEALVEGSFDAVSLWDVIEHLPDPYAFARRAVSLLRPGGILYVKTPDIHAATVTAVVLAPRLAGAVLSVPHHVQFFQRASLARLLERAGATPTAWLPTRTTRSPSAGGSLRRRAARRVVSAVHRATGAGNLFVFAARD